MAETFACTSFSKNNNVGDFAALEASLAWATEKSPFTGEREDKKILTCGGLFQWQG